MHLCEQHHLEYVNAPETVNNPMRLCFSLPFFEAFCTDKLFINEGERDRVTG